MKQLIIAFVVVVSIGLFAPEGAAQAPSSVQGQVCTVPGYYSIMAPEGEAWCGRGVPGANVSLHAPAATGVAIASTTTDAKGSFVLTAPADGTYVLRVERTGFAALEREVQAPAADLVLQPAAQQVRQEGIVQGARGPVAAAQVHACCEGQAPATTGPDGRFSLDVTAGWHELYVRASGHYETGMEAFLDGARQVEVRLEPLPPPDAYVLGTVRDQDGTPVAGATVEASGYWATPMPEARSEASAGGQDGSEGGDPDRAQEDAVRSMPAHPGNRTTTAADGTYRLGVPSGAVALSIHKEGYAPAWTQVEVAKGDERREDLELLRYPERTARIEGRVTGPDGQALQPVSVHVESPLFGRYECSQGPADAQATKDGGVGDDAARRELMVEPAYPGCAIEVREDGTFVGMVTPGYSIVRVTYQDWYACSGRSSDCPGYIPFVRTMDLPADTTTRLDIQLDARPVPSAELSGYLVDSTQGTAIPGGQVSLARLDAGGYGWAGTDEDGSYRIRLAPGIYEVSAWADGFLAWAGIVEVDGQTSLDIMMTPGRSGGGCCYPMPLAADADGGKTYGAPSMAAEERSAGSDGTAGRTGSGDSANQSESDSDFADLGGGLGPYDARSRQESADGQGSDNDAPGAPALLAALAVLGLAWAARRR